MTSWKTLFIAVSLLCLAPPSLMAEEPPAATHREVQIAPKDVQTAVFVLKHADAKAVAKLLADFTEYLGGSIKADADGHSLAVVGSMELVGAVGSALDRLDTDQAPKSVRTVELTFHLLWLTKHGQIEANLPPELQGVIAQMKGIYKGIQLLGTSITQTTEGKEGKIEVIRGVGDLPGELDSPKIPYSVGFGEVRLTPGVDAKTWTIQVPVQLFAQISLKTGSSERREALEVKSRLELHGNQPVAVGSTSTGVAGASLCLVVSAKVLD
ncbi:MAG TPA: hypothetical protein PKL14_01900 [Holophaga sp.]|jgi:hypothetical protein|nr:hypothetical protein [Holophaga sp.]